MRTQMTGGTTDVMPYVVVAQMSLQDRNQSQFDDAAKRMMQQFPQSEYSYFFQGVQHLQNRDFKSAQASLERARALGMSEESIAELLKTAIDNQKWIWEYAVVLSAVVGVWLLGLAVLYLLGNRMLRRTLAGAAADASTGTASDTRMRLWYRRLIGFAGLYYYVSLPIVVVVSIALPLTIGYAMLMVPYLNLLLVVGALLLGVGGVVTAVSGLRTAFIRIPPDDNDGSVAPDQAPELWAVAREVAQAVGTRPVDRIRITPGADLAVYERGSFLDRLRDRGERVLILGVALLEGMKLDALRAVLAHEYGHFQNRDTAGGDIALRVRAAMDRFALAVVMRGKIRRWDVALRFLLFYHLIFRRLTFGASRLQEIFADRTAVMKYGAGAFCEGLRHAIRRSVEVDWALDKILGDVVRTQRPAANFYGARPTPNLREREQIETTLKELIERPTDAEDSHPGPQERFSFAEKIDSSVKPLANEPAAKLLASRPDVVRDMNRRIARGMDDQARELAGQFSEGLRVLSNILNNVQNLDALFERAKIYSAQGNDAAAVADYTAMIQEAPGVAILRFMRA
ncbi:MAG: M48 family metalloprotease [Pirellulales bacterium]